MSLIAVGVLLVSFLGLGAISQPASTEGKRYVEIRWTETDSPSLELSKDNVPSVILPLGLKKAIDKHFPGYRVPGNQDYRGDWEAFYDYVSPEEREKKSRLKDEQLKSEKVPFITLGDFNHDKVQDIAVMLVKEMRSNFWKLVVFHGGETGYQPTTIVLSPDVNDNNRDLGPLQRYSIKAKAKCRDGRECLTLSMYEASSFQYIWKNGLYIETSTAD